MIHSKRWKIWQLILLVGSGLCLAATTGVAEDNFDFFFKNDNDYKKVRVQDVLSTDTIVIETVLSKGEKIRFIGVKGLEPPQKRKERPERDQYGFVLDEEVSPLTPLEEQAYDYAYRLLKDQYVRIELDHQKKSEDHATLGYVFLIDTRTFVNADLLSRGYADLSIRPPNTKYEEQLRSAYQEARKEKRGLHGQ